MNTPKGPVTLSPETPEDARRLADAIERIDVHAKRLIHSGLSRRALVLLLSDATGVGKRDCEKVLDGLASLRKHYLTAAAPAATVKPLAKAR